MFRHFFFIVLLGNLVCLVGCAGPVPPVEINGKVTYDGKPLTDGEISFITEGNPPETMPIKNGAFAGKVTPGKKRIEIYGYRESKQQISPEEPGASTISSKENFIPALYNTESKITEDIKSGASLKYDLKKSG